MNQRAWSILEIKSVNEDQRILEGIASTPSTDRVGDVMEPEGAKFTLPMPFLWQHQKDSPIGHVTEARVSRDGIRVKVQLAQTDEPGALKDLLDRAWQSIKLGLVRGLSIGFLPGRNAGDAEPIRGTMGVRFKSWEWYELSAVTIPANASTSIMAIKAADLEFTEPGASGEEETHRRSLPGASGIPIKSTPKREKMQTATEHTQDLMNARAAKAARVEEIQKTVATANRTKNEAEREEFDTLKAEIKDLDLEIQDAREAEAIMAAGAKAVDTTPKSENGSRSRDSHIQVIEREEKLEPGIAFSRMAMLQFAAKGNLELAAKLAKTHYPRMKGLQDIFGLQSRVGMGMDKIMEHSMLLQKANVVAASTTDSDWAGALVAHNDFAGDFVEFLRPRTIIGQFGTNGRPALRRIPFNVHIKGQTVGGTGYWVGEGKPKPVTAFGYEDVYHAWYKVAAIAVLTEEIVRFSDPSAERLVRESLADVLTERIDTDFIDPAITLVANTRPASITNGVTAITSSGDTADDVRADLLALFADAMAADVPLTGAVLVTTPSIAMALSLMTNTFGQPEFGGMTMNGGTLQGIPVIVSNYVPAGTVVLVLAPEVYLSDDGQATIDISREASLQMLDNPTNDTVTPTATSLVSMFQTDSIALRAHRFINYSKRRDEAVAVLEEVGWGGAATS